MNDRTAATDVGTANLQFARALVRELHRAGAVAAFVCPGSRSTPLALAIAETATLPRSVHVDERSAAFHALGYAKASGRPVILLCTSGTAGANFLPAIAEAFHSRVPVIVLTADRPPELRAWGAAQTMEQRDLFAGFTRWSEESPCPSERPAETRYAQALGRRAVVEATGPAPGPVHLNIPFREPLLPAMIAAPHAASDDHFTDAVAIEAASDATGLLRDLRGIERGVLLFGPDAWDSSLAGVACAAADALGWPVIADPGSGLRCGAGLEAVALSGADLLLRHGNVADRLRPDLVVRFGGLQTSATVSAWIARHEAADVWLVDPAAGFRDPQHRVNRTFRMSASHFCASAAGAATGSAKASQVWRDEWRRADRIAREAASAAIYADSRFLTPHIALELWSRLPEHAALYIANSMAIREVDAFAGPRAADLRVLANRGVNGIDGLVSAALGATAALQVPSVLWCGDLALLHDVSGLVAGSMQHANLTIVVSNDDGGGIFEYLPAARSIERPVFEEMFAVPHGIDLLALARGLGWEATRAESPHAFASALDRSLAGGLHVIEVPIDRAANTAFHAAIHAAVGARLSQEWPS
jgi:2-succinyl-5-enolpyruvyl-6-hydroxy-3-cyclohexene-1-carboxylate synthase